MCVAATRALLLPPAAAPCRLSCVSSCSFRWLRRLNGLLHVCKQNMAKRSKSQTHTFNSCLGTCTRVDEVSGCHDGNRIMYHNHTCTDAISGVLLAAPSMNRNHSGGTAGCTKNAKKIVLVVTLAAEIRTNTFLEEPVAAPSRQRDSPDSTTGCTVFWPKP